MFKNVADKITLLLANQHAEHAPVVDFVKMQVLVVLRILFSQEL